MDVFTSVGSYFSDGDFGSIRTLSYGESISGAFIHRQRKIWDTFSVTLFVRCMKVFLAVPIETKHSECAIKVRFAILVGVVALMTTFDSVKSFERFQLRISSLEFTAIAITIYRFCYNATNILMVVKIFCVPDKISQLMANVNRVCLHSYETPDGSMIIRRKVRIVAILLWLAGMISIAAVLIACFVCFRGIAYKQFGHAITQSIDNRSDCSWTCSMAYPFFGTAPVWVTFLTYLSGFTLAVGIDVFPQLLIILIIYPLGLCFTQFAHSMRTFVRHNLPGQPEGSPSKHTSIFLRRQTAFHLELSNLVLDMDNTFSFLFFLMYTGDLMGFIATASLFLHHKSGMMPGNIDFELLPVFAALVSVSCFNAIIRTFYSISLNERAHSVLPYLYEINLKVTSDEDKFLCSSFISRLQGSRVALTAGGFFYITREFVITIFGVLITYILFVYQMQDQKQDMSMLPKLADIAAFAFKQPQKEILVHLNANSSALR